VLKDLDLAIAKLQDLCGGEEGAAPGTGSSNGGGSDGDGVSGGGSGGVKAVTSTAEASVVDGVSDGRASVSSDPVSTIHGAQPEAATAGGGDSDTAAGYRVQPLLVTRARSGEDDTLPLPQWELTWDAEIQWSASAAAAAVAAGTELALDVEVAMVLPEAATSAGGIEVETVDGRRVEIIFPLSFGVAAVLLSPTATVGPGGYCPPRHWMPFNSRDQGESCVG